MSTGLTAADFAQIASNGFGEPENAYCHAMCNYNDEIYVGTTRHSMALLKLFPPLDPPAMNPWPVKAPQRVQDLDMRGQIWRRSKSGGWQKVYTSPLIEGRDGESVPRDLGYRGMAVFQGRSDPKPTLYVASMSTVLRGTAAHILRLTDVETFEPVSEPGLGDRTTSTFRSLVAFDGHIYAPPAGEGVSFNSNRSSILFRSADPLTQNWERSCKPGFGDPTNSGIFELAALDNYLYAGTFNHHSGYQIWKTPATGTAPCRWTKVIDRGAYRGNRNEIAMSICPFGGALYVGSAIQNGGYDRSNFVGPASGEIIRIYADDSWDLLVGTPRYTPHGFKYPLSGMGPGFDNIFAGYIWRMAVHEGWLYASTFDWSVFLPYAKRPSQRAESLIRRFGVDHILSVGGGFDLWRTQDGVNWTPITQNGFGNAYNYGARTLVSSSEGLFVGTANPFGPKVAARLATEWIYVLNPKGGAEVWLGQSPQRRASADPAVATDKRLNGFLPATCTASIKNSRLAEIANTTAVPQTLLTGASGFIGSHVLEYLISRGKRVRVLALPGTEPENLSSDKVEIINGDLRSERSLVDAARGIQIVYHLAGVTPGRSYKELVEVNVHGMENLLRACRRSSDLQRFVMTSSVAVYGGPFRPSQWPFTENSPLRPGGSKSLRDYGKSKVAAESLLQRYAVEMRFDYVILRPSTCYGPGGKFIEDLIHRVLIDPAAGLGPGGHLIMQILHVRDLAELISKVGEHPRAANEIFNVAGAEAPSYEDFASLVRRRARQSNLLSLIPHASAIQRRFSVPYAIIKAQRELSFLPRVKLADGLNELIASINLQTSG